MTPDMRVRIGSLELANPVGLASGTFGRQSDEPRFSLCGLRQFYCAGTS